MKRNKSWLIIGSFLIIVGIGLIGYDYYSNKVINDNEDIDSDILLIMMTNNYINNLYVDIEFNEKIKIETNKKTRRNTYAHGKFYSNKRIDSIMLLNTIYYLLVAQEILKKYENKLFYKDKVRFYIPTRAEKKKAIENVKNSIRNKN